MRSDLAERMLAHFVAGAWRAPLSVRMRDLPLSFGERPARLVEADDADVRRALEAASPVSSDCEAARDGLLALADEIAALREMETGHAEPLVLRTVPELPRDGHGSPILVLGSVGASAGQVAGCILAGLEAGRPVLFKPAPRAAASGTLVAEALARADLPAGAFALLQGGGATTGAALLAAIGAWTGREKPVVLLPGKTAPRAAIAAAARDAGLPLLPLAAG